LHSSLPYVPQLLPHHTPLPALPPPPAFPAIQPSIMLRLKVCATATRAAITSVKQKNHGNMAASGGGCAGGHH
jgi:hypothetical protein